MGVVVDEEAINKFLISDKELAPFRDEEKPYDFTRPRFIRTATYLDGRQVHFSNVLQGFQLEAYSPGVSTKYWKEDGTEEFEKLWITIKEQPIING